MPVWSLHGLPVSVGLSSFLAQSKNIHVSSIGHCKVSVCVNVCANGCLFLCSPAMSWRLVRGLTLPPPYDRFQQNHVILSSGTRGYRKEIDGATIFYSKFKFNPFALFFLKKNKLKDS